MWFDEQENNLEKNEYMCILFSLYSFSILWKCMNWYKQRHNVFLIQEEVDQWGEKEIKNFKEFAL